MRHLALPLRLDSAGGFATVAQDSAEDIAQSLGVLLATRPGERTAVPGYGTSDPLGAGPDVQSLREALNHWEPRGREREVTLATDGATTTVRIEGGT